MPSKSYDFVLNFNLLIPLPIAENILSPIFIPAAYAIPPTIDVPNNNSH